METFLRTASSTTAVLKSFVTKTVRSFTGNGLSAISPTLSQEESASLRGAMHSTALTTSRTNCLEAQLRRCKAMLEQGPGRLTHGGDIQVPGDANRASKQAHVYLVETF